MAAWFAAALRAVPWATLISQAPQIIEASQRLFSQRPPGAAGPDPGQAEPPRPGLDGQLDELYAHLRALEASDAQQTQLANRVAEQLQGLTQGLQVLAARQRLVLGLSGTALLVALIALVLSVV